jgi:hypothetical protein
VGRPLGMATASTTMDLAAGGSWAFQTGTVDDARRRRGRVRAGSIP